jgi:4-diphosphocytidyl-2C-methyl-D-erythritol kinase
LPDCLLLIAQPDAGISTPESFQRYDKLANVRHPDVESLAGAIKAGNIKGVASCLGNVLENVAELREIPELKSIMLGAGALGSLMSGSGRRYSESLKADGWQNAACERFTAKRTVCCLRVRFSMAPK